MCDCKTCPQRYFTHKALGDGPANKVCPPVFGHAPMAAPLAIRF